MMEKTEIFLVRHGQPVLQNALLGSTDSPLSELGWSQLEASAKSLPDVDAIVASPLSRCAAFAQQHAADCELELLIDGSWKECDFGEWDGKTYQSLYQSHPSQVEAFFTSPDKNTPPRGEMLMDFCARVEAALNKLLEQYKGQKVALYTHAGVIRTLVAWCLKMDYASGLQFRRFAIDYASITHLSIFHSEQESAQNEKLFPQLMSLNHVN